MSDYICQDNVVQILKWLPVKTLLRFRCVCKWMKATIDSHSFMLDHLAVQNPQLIVQSGLRHEERGFLALDPRTLPSFNSLIDPIGTERLFLIGTLHGVVCLYDVDIGLRLWNPSTREFSTRPLPPLPKRLGFRWDTLDQRYYCSGFWIDPSNKDFKVIMFDDVTKAVLYKSIEEGWIELDVGEQVRTCVVHVNDDNANVGPTLMIGGVAYWLCEYEGECIIENRGTPILLGIVSFDFGHEIFNLIKMPETHFCIGTVPGMHDHVHFNGQGKLSLVYWYKEQNRCDVYSRQEGSWANTYSLNLISPINEVFWVLDGIEGEGRVLASTDQDLFLYDTRVGIIRLKEEGWYRFYYAFMAYGFVESLLFP